MPPNQSITLLALMASGGLNAGTPSDTASIPVSAVHPAEKARKKRNKPIPSRPGGCGSYGASGRKSKTAPATPYPIMPRILITKR